MASFRRASSFIWRRGPRWRSPRLVGEIEYRSAAAEDFGGDPGGQEFEGVFAAVEVGVDAGEDVGF